MTAFDPQRAQRWLETVPADADGTVASWVNVSHPGFAYPEAAAIVLRLVRESQHDSAVVEPIAAQLRRDVKADCVGKNGRRYPFDLGVVLAALAAEDPAFVAGLRTQLLEALEDPRSFDPLPGTGHRWSTTRGPHLLKLAVSLVVSSRALGCPAGLDVLDGIPIDQHASGRLETYPHAATYVHAHCYGAEGLLALAHAGGGGETTRARGVDAVRWLATIQDPQGSIPAWHDGTIGSGPRPADTCAQAIRLWCLVDPVGFADPIARGLDYLDTLTDPSGALRYHAESGDLNTWATAFAIQACRWARGEEERDPVAVL